MIEIGATDEETRRFAFISLLILKFVMRGFKRF